MDSSLQSLLEGRIDFEGQKLADVITRVVLISSTVLSFVIGFITQSLRTTFGIIGIGAAAVCLIVVPPWSIYNRNPVKWLPVKNDVKKK